MNLSNKKYKIILLNNFNSSLKVKFDLVAFAACWWYWNKELLDYTAVFFNIWFIYVFM